MLKTFSELTHINRGDPCIEFPGEWLVGIPEYLGEHWSRFWFQESRVSLGHSFQTFEEALKLAKEFLGCLQNAKVRFKPKDIYIFWKCSDNDVRIGQTWFTPVYTHGRFDILNNYKRD